MQKTIIVCDNCGKELASPGRYHIDFASSRFCDAAGDMDYNAIRVDLCENCARNAVQSLKKIAERNEK